METVPYYIIIYQYSTKRGGGGGEKEKLLTMIGITVLNWTVNLTSVIIQSDYNLIRINQVTSYFHDFILHHCSMVKYILVSCTCSVPALQRSIPHLVQTQHNFL